MEYLNFSFIAGFSDTTAWIHAKDSAFEQVTYFYVCDWQVLVLSYPHCIVPDDCYKFVTALWCTVAFSEPREQKKRLYSCSSTADLLWNAIKL